MDPINNIANAELPELEDWLDIATDKLSEPAIDRIEDEIYPHVASILAANSGDLFDAINMLGSPSKANRRYRWRYLNERDVQAITDVLAQRRFRFINCALMAAIQFSFMGKALYEAVNINWVSWPVVSATAFASTCVCLLLLWGIEFRGRSRDHAKVDRQLGGVMMFCLSGICFLPVIGILAMVMTISLQMGSLLFLLFGVIILLAVHLPMTMASLRILQNREDSIAVYRDFLENADE